MASNSFICLLKEEFGLDVDATQGGVRTRYVLADRPCVSQKIVTLRRGANVNWT